MKYFLKEPVLKQWVHAKAGEEILFIADHDNVWIVSTMDGIRFSIKADKVTTDQIDPEPKERTEEPTLKPPDIKVRRVANRPITPKLSEDQGSLF